MIEFKRTKHYDNEKTVIRRITIKQVSPPVRVALAVPVDGQQEFDANINLYVDAIVDYLVEGWDLPIGFPSMVSMTIKMI